MQIYLNMLCQAKHLQKRDLPAYSADCVFLWRPVNQAYRACVTPSGVSVNFQSLKKVPRSSCLHKRDSECNILISAYINEFLKAEFCCLTIIAKRNKTS
jgi:hypothetical protein